MACCVPAWVYGVTPLGCDTVYPRYGMVWCHTLGSVDTTWVTMWTFAGAASFIFSTIYLQFQSCLVTFWMDEKNMFLSFWRPVMAPDFHIYCLHLAHVRRGGLCVYSAHCLTIPAEYWKSVPLHTSQTFMFGPKTNFRVSTTKLCSAVLRKHIQDTLRCIFLSLLA